MASGARCRLRGSRVRSLDEHRSLATALVSRGPGESVPLAAALGRVTARDHVAVHPSPPFDNSAMDGYALRAADLGSAAAATPVVLSVVGEARAGSAPSASVGGGQAVRIMTGAPLPHGADAVVAQEVVVREGDTAVFVAPTGVGSHIRRRGEDVSPGDVVLPTGVTLGPRHLAAGGASGLAELDVVAKPRVGYLVTGDELVGPGAALEAGQIHDSNGIYLAAALSRLGAVPIALGTVGDDAEDVLAALSTADVDLLVTTGGASVGDYDPVKAALAPLGVDFGPVAMQPGKPQGIGRVGAVPVLCLPGNPVAVAVCVELFVGAAVRVMLGIAEPEWSRAVAGASWTSPQGREQVMPAVLDAEGQVLPATSGGSGSHLAGRLASATALARVPAAQGAVQPGDTVLIRRFTA
jgi:molybdopterin molybdotransferase